DLIEIESRVGWDHWRTAVTFSFVQRGWPYFLWATNKQAEYLTHPTRWLVMRNTKAELADSSFGLAVGGIILGSIKDGIIRPDAREIVNTLAEIRSKVHENGIVWGEADNPDKARDLIIPMLPGVV